MPVVIRRSSGSLALALAVSVVALAGHPVAADTDRGHRGDVGEHSLRDTRDRPGARCFYVDGGGGGKQVLHYLRVRPPVVYAGFAGKFVGWRVVLQRRPRSGGRWASFDRSGIQLGVSKHDGPIKLHPITLQVRSEFRHDIRARVRMIWYGYGYEDAPSGKALHEVDWYRHIYRSEDYGDNLVTLRDACPDYHYLDI